MNKQLSDGWLRFLREQYPPGSRIKLQEMKDPFAPLPPGSTGTLDHIDDMGTFHMKWDNGRSLGLIVGEDRFSVVPPELTTLKLYMPLTADYYERDTEWEDEPDCVNSRWLCPYESEILAAMVRNRLPEESERGLMHWYDCQDSVNSKVHSAVFSVENREGQLWGVAECRIFGQLDAGELSTLKEYVTGQASDGWGEGFEQREIDTEDGTVYVHLWNSEDWSIKTEQEQFSPALSEELPNVCFSTLKTTGELICIKKGERGYYPSDWNTQDREENTALAQQLNQKLGVSPEQRQAMEIGSMCGWEVPGADPAFYRKSAPKMGGMKLE